MMLIGTLIVLGLWVAFIWYADRDGLITMPVERRSRKPMLGREERRSASLREAWLYGEKETGPS